MYICMSRICLNRGGPEKRVCGPGPREHPLERPARISEKKIVRHVKIRQVGRDLLRITENVEIERVGIVQQLKLLEGEP